MYEEPSCEPRRYNWALDNVVGHLSSGVVANFRRGPAPHLCVCLAKFVREVGESRLLFPSDARMWCLSRVSVNRVRTCTVFADAYLIRVPREHVNGWPVICLPRSNSRPGLRRDLPAAASVITVLFAWFRARRRSFGRRLIGTRGRSPVERAAVYCPTYRAAVCRRRHGYVSLTVVLRRGNSDVRREDASRLIRYFSIPKLWLVVPSEFRAYCPHSELRRVC